MSKDQGFTISKLEDRIAPSSGVLVTDDIANGSVSNVGNASDVGNVSDIAHGNSLFGGNSASTDGNTVGNASFNG